MILERVHVVAAVLFVAAIVVQVSSRAPRWPSSVGPWIWTSIVVLVAIIVVMYLVATPFFKSLRLALGQRVPGTSKDAPEPTPLPDAEILALAAKSPIAVLAGAGFGGLLLILWLMVLKPF